MKKTTELMEDQDDRVLLNKSIITSSTQRRKKQKTCGDLAKDYMNGFKLVFSNKASALILAGCSFRLYETAIVSFFQQKYFKVYQSQYSTYSTLMTFGTFGCGIIANSLSGIILDFFDKKSEMTLPILCAVKALINVPFCIMTYMQQSNFYLSIVGIYCMLLFAKGWTAPAILMIKTVSDPSVESIAVAMFLLF